MLSLAVLLAGMASLGLEMAASRFLAPFFGSSLYIWGILVGLILVYLTIGYWFGGLLADRRPERSTFLKLSILAAVAMAAVGLVADPVLRLSLLSTERVPYGLFWGALGGCILLFAVPVALLGSLNPFAIRLSVARVGNAGNVSGRIFALTTIGSLVGTFGAVFLLIPLYGTRATVLVFAAVLLLVPILGYASGWQAREPARP